VTTRAASGGSDSELPEAVSFPGLVG
jgi:hypothetical protein